LNKNVVYAQKNPAYIVTKQQTDCAQQRIALLFIVQNTVKKPVIFYKCRFLR